MAEEVTPAESQSSPPGMAQGQQPTGPSCPRALPAPGPAAQKELFKILQQARVLLNDGEEDKARAELDCVHQLEADNKQLACLLRGINTDMSSAHAGDSTPYMVRPGETLGSIAQRFLGDSCEFYMLARFNKIKVPKQLSVGQTIRLPGRINVAAPPPSTPAPSPAPAPSAAVKPPPVAAVPKETPAPPPAQPAPDRRAEIDNLWRRGEGEFRSQRLDGAMRYYDAILAIDPNHTNARVRRQQALELKAKLDGLGKK